MRFLLKVEKGSQIRVPQAWLNKVVGRLLVDEGRRRDRAPTEFSTLAAAGHGKDEDDEGDDDAWWLIDADPWSDPAQSATLTDYIATAPERFARYLPPPLTQMAHLQYIEGWSRNEIGTWLQLWVPEVGDEKARQLLRHMHSYFRAVEQGEPIPVELQKYGLSKNPFSHTPPSSRPSYPLGGHRWPQRPCSLGHGPELYPKQRACSEGRDVSASLESTFPRALSCP